jgi:heat-inducible transcriptional repressor
LSDAVDLNDVVERSVRLLSQLTRQVAVVQYPSLRESAVRRIELVRMTRERALAVVVSADARVEQASVAVPADLTDEDFETIAREVNEVAKGLTPAPLARALTEWVDRHAATPWLESLASVVSVAARGGTVERVVFAGTGNLTRAGSDLGADAVSSVLDALEEQVVLLRLLHEMAAEGHVAVRIGSETGYGALAGTSIVAAGYGNTETPSLLGALGPTRMDYPATMAAVRAVARYLSKVVQA